MIREDPTMYYPVPDKSPGPARVLYKLPASSGNEAGGHMA